MTQLDEALARQREKLIAREPPYGDRLDREELTSLCLYHSLCPIHLVDYAICFDDQDPECAQVRLIHPGHDT